MAAASDVGLKSFDPLVGESGSGVHPDAAVVGLGAIGHDRYWVEVLGGEDGLGLGGEGEDGVLHVRRCERLVVGEDPLDVLHAGHHQVAEGLGVEHAVLVSERGGDGVGLGEVVGVEGAPGGMAGTACRGLGRVGALLVVAALFVVRHGGPSACL